MKYKKPKDFKSHEEMVQYMNDNNLVMVRGNKENYFMDADDYYLGGENE